MVRGESYTREDIFAFIPKVIPIFTISLLVGIFSLLWGLLLIIPGIIAAISYSMAYYLFVEDDSKLPMEYLTESKRMMKGYKMDYFIFMLSFIGWILLSFLTFGILLIWVIPYIAFSEAIYFDELKKITANKCE